MRMRCICMRGRGLRDWHFRRQQVQTELCPLYKMNFFEMPEPERQRLVRLYDNLIAPRRALRDNVPCTEAAEGVNQRTLRRTGLCMCLSENRYRLFIRKEMWNENCCHCSDFVGGRSDTGRCIEKG